MSLLSEFLQAKQPLFDHALRQLEQRTGNKNADAKLTAELAEKSAQFTKFLGLQPDCSGEELYAALTKKIQEQDAHLAATIGGKNYENVAEMVPLAIRRIDQIHMPRDCYALKYEKAAEMLAKYPPLELMKRLGYDDAKTLIEKEDLAELFIAIRFTEGPEWLNEFNTVYKTLKPEDFETRKIKLIRFDGAKWGNVAEHFIIKKKHINTHSKEMGVVAILHPPHREMKAITLKVITLTLHYYNEVRLYSAYFKFLAKQPNSFGKTFVRTLIADTPPVNLVVGADIHWRVIQRYYGKVGESAQHPEVFQPHLQPEDLHWRAAEKILYQIDPEMKVWHEMDYVATKKPDGVVTFNLMDVALSYANEIDYSDRYLYHFQESLWNEVFARYLGDDVLREQLLVKLDNAVVEPEDLTDDENN